MHLVCYVTPGVIDFNKCKLSKLISEFIIFTKFNDIVLGSETHRVDLHFPQGPKNYIH